MKTNKKRIAVSILTVFMMVFSVIPYMGAKADIAYATTADEFNVERAIRDITKADYGKEFQVETFYADDTVSLTVLAEHYSYSYQDYNFKLRLYDPNGNVVSPSSGNGYLGNTVWESSKFSTAGGYTLKLFCGYTGLASGVGYDLTLTMKKDRVYTNKFASLNTSIMENGYIALNIGSYDGPSTLMKDINQVMYRVANGKIKQVAWYDYDGYSTYDSYIDYATTYTYYVANLDMLSPANKAALEAVTQSSVTLTEAHKAALADPYVTASEPITTAGPEIAPITNVKVWSKGVRWVELGWIGAGDGYQLKSYDKNGVLRATVNADGYGNYGTKIYVAYDGTSKVTIQPYVVLDGEKYWGDMVTATGLTSAKLKATGGNVTKMSNTKASITVGRSSDAKGIQIQQKKGTKWVNIKKAATAKTVKVNWTKNKAGQTKYRFREYLVDKNGKTYYSAWRTLSPKANQATYTKMSVSGCRNLYGWQYTTYFKPNKISYSNGKLKVVGQFVNTGYATRTCKVKVTFKVDGKTIGTKTVSCKVGGEGNVTKTFTLNNSVKGKDLYRVSYSIKYLQRGY